MHCEWIKTKQKGKSWQDREESNRWLTYHQQADLGGKIYFMGSDSDRSENKFARSNASDHKQEKKHNSLKHILIVEDDRVSTIYIQELINMLDLPGINIQVHNVFTGERALEHIRQMHCNLVLMDLKLPGMDGLETTREIKRIRPFLPVIAQTAFALSGDEQKALQAGCDDYISKPISEKDLTDVIKKFLAGT